MNNRLWVLGASDPEMERIERLLTECGEEIRYATIDGGRVRPGTAYRADEIEIAAGVDQIILVECAAATYGDSIPKIIRIDHHREGDVGFGRPPEEFLEASSIGQVISYLARNRILDVSITTAWSDPDRNLKKPSDFKKVGCMPTAGKGNGWILYSERFSRHLVSCRGRGNWCGWREIPIAYVLTAAADHCLGAAYRGECPGVDPDELMQWRAESRAAHQGRSVEEVLADVEAAMGELNSAKFVELTNIADAPHTVDHDWSRTVCDDCADYTVAVADMRREKPIPELPEAAARLGIGYISGPLVGPDGREKYTCSGSENQIQAFLEDWGPANGLVDLYGDPARGFAGGYK